MIFGFPLPQESELKGIYKMITKEMIRRHFEYHDGMLFKDGKRRGFDAKNRGYRQITLGSREKYYEHRVIWIYHNGEIPEGLEIDHINGKRNDNRIENLRLVTRAENNKNTGTKRGDIGVYFEARKWRAKITVDYEQKDLGRFDKKSDAISARKRAEKQYNFHSNHGRKI